MWRFGGFISVGAHIDCGSAMSLFRNPRNYMEEKMFVLDIWIPFFTVRVELRKNWPGHPIKGGEWYWERGYGPGKMIEAKHDRTK